MNVQWWAQSICKGPEMSVKMTCTQNNKYSRMAREETFTSCEPAGTKLWRSFWSMLNRQPEFIQMSRSFKETLNREVTWSGVKFRKKSECRVENAWVGVVRSSIGSGKCMGSLMCYDRLAALCSKKTESEWRSRQILKRLFQLIGWARSWWLTGCGGWVLGGIEDNSQVFNWKNWMDGGAMDLESTGKMVKIW